MSVGSSSRQLDFVFKVHMAQKCVILVRYCILELHTKIYSDTMTVTIFILKNNATHSGHADILMGCPVSSDICHCSISILWGIVTCDYMYLCMAPLYHNR